MCVQVVQSSIPGSSCSSWLRPHFHCYPRSRLGSGRDRAAAHRRRGRHARGATREADEDGYRRRPQAASQPAIASRATGKVRAKRGHFRGVPIDRARHGGDRHHGARSCGPARSAMRPTRCAACRASRSAGTAASGNLTEVRIRGAEANHTLVLIDGIEVNEPDRRRLRLLRALGRRHRAHRGDPRPHERHLRVERRRRRDQYHHARRPRAAQVPARAEGAASRAAGPRCGCRAATTALLVRHL